MSGSSPATSAARGRWGGGRRSTWIDVGDPAESTTPSRPPPSQTPGEEGPVLGAQHEIRRDTSGLHPLRFGLAALAFWRPTPPPPDSIPPFRLAALAFWRPTPPPPAPLDVLRALAVQPLPPSPSITDGRGRRRGG